jgi:hypothetical protein
MEGGRCKNLNPIFREIAKIEQQGRTAARAL